MKIFIENSTEIGRFYYTGAYEKRIYRDGQRTDDQETNVKGVGLWSVRTQLVQEESAPESVVVVVPIDRNPSEGLKPGEEIVFADMSIVSGSRATGGRWERIEAEKIGRMKTTKSAGR